MSPTPLLSLSILLLLLSAAGSAPSSPPLHPPAYRLSPTSQPAAILASDPLAASSVLEVRVLCAENEAYEAAGPARFSSRKSGSHYTISVENSSGAFWVTAHSTRASVKIAFEPQDGFRVETMRAEDEAPAVLFAVIKAAGVKLASVTVDGTKAAECDCDVCVYSPAKGAGYDVLCLPTFYTSRRLLDPTCDSSCSTCSTPSDATKCTACSSSTDSLSLASTSDTEGTCVASCPSGTYQDISNPPAKCYPCDSTCSTCTAYPATCTSCASSTDKLSLSSTSATAGTCVASCLSGTVEDTSHTKCYPCESSCASCSVYENSAKCLTCSDSSAKISVSSSSDTAGTCVSMCPSATVEYTSHTPSLCYPCDHSCSSCSTYESPGSCTGCSTSGYKLSLASSLSTSGTCISACPIGYIEDTSLSQAKCYPCDSTCSACTIRESSSSCTSCVNSAYRLSMATSAAMAGTCVASCVGATIEVTSYTPSRCYPCDSSCSSCSVYENPAACTGCASSGYRLSLASTSATAGTCIATCLAGTAEDTTSSQAKCYPCDSSCATCFVYADANSCLTCTTSGNYLVFASSSATAGSCQSSCPTGWAEGTSAGKCYPCAVGCATCSSPEDSAKCLTCSASGYRLVLASTSSTAGTCQSVCPSGTAEDTTASTQTKCYPCDALCSTCSVYSDATKCTACATAGDKLKLASVSASAGQCVATCPVGTALDSSGTQAKCYPCVSTCATCSVYNDASQCETCSVAGYYLVLSSSSATAGNCVSSCPVGSAADTSSAAQYKCYPCDSTCAVCSAYLNPLKCTTCSASGAYLVLSAVASTEGYCMASCPSGTAGDTTAAQYKCYPCDTSCTTCSVYQNAAKCTACSAVGYRLSLSAIASTAGTCVATCAAGTAEDSSGTPVKCYPCASSCSTCTIYQDSTKCLTCYTAGYRLVLASTSATVGTCQSTCPAGTAEDTSGTQAKCYPCSATCATCSVYQDSTKCLTCATAGYYLILATTSDTAGYCAIACPGGTAADTTGTIKKCYPCATSCFTCSIYQNANKCTSCPAGKLLSSSTTGSCGDTCPTHYSPDTSAGTTCLPCDSSCDECTTPADSTKCTACVSPKLLKGATVGPCVSAPCPDHYAIDSTATKCLDCSSTCTTCVSPADYTQCSSCPSGYYLVGSTTGQCLSSCPTHTALDSTGKKCLSCDSSCEECSSPGFATLCTACPSGKYLVGTTVGSCASVCPSGTVLYPAGSTTCRSCDSSCQECSIPASASSCTSCLSPLLLYGGTCVSSPCPSHYAANSDSTKCLACDTTCSECATPANWLQCTVCYSGSYVLGITSGECVSTCPSHYAIDLTSTNCLVCDSTCKECNQPGSSTHCKTCPTGNLLVGTSNGYCVSACPTHTALDPVGQINCYVCDSSCDECSAPSNSAACTACVSPKVLYGSSVGTCISLPCPDGYAVNSASTKCLACDSSCSTCSAPGDNTKCTACPTGTYLYSGKCLASCPSKYAVDSSGTKCLACASSCAECSLPSSSTKCTSCASGYYLIGSVTGTCQSNCPSGMALNSPANTSCLNCDTSCAQCSIPSSASKCTSCSTWKLLLGEAEGTCINSPCPSGYAVDSSGTKCLSCDSSCSECVSPKNSSGCSSCPSGKRLLGSVSGACISPPCPSDTLENAAATKCLYCDVSCATCLVVGDSNSCTSCYSGKLLLYPTLTSTSGSCISSPCPSHYAINSAGTNCQACDSSCSECSSANDPSACTSCSGSLLLEGETTGPCVTSCPTNSVLSSDGKRCLSCASGCLTCGSAQNASSCKTCPAGTYLDYPPVGSCVTVCPTGTAANTADRMCEACHVTCAECNLPGQAGSCISCVEGRVFYPLNSSCLLSCPDGYLYDNSTARCLACDASCAKCSVPADKYSCYRCTTDSQGYLLKKVGTRANLTGDYNETLGMCVSQCPSGTFLNTVNNATCYADACPTNMYTNTTGPSCQPCDSSCESCLLPSDPNYCSSCASGFLRVNTTDFNLTLANATSATDSEPHYTMYGTCVDSCGADDLVNKTTSLCYIYPSHAEEALLEEEQRVASMAAVSGNSLLYFCYVDKHEIEEQLQDCLRAWRWCSPGAWVRNRYV